MDDKCKDCVDYDNLELWGTGKAMRCAEYAGIIKNLRADLAASQGRIAQLEEALTETLNLPYEGRKKVIDKAIASPSAAAEVLRAAGEFEQAYERGNGRRQSDAKCTLLHAVRKYKDGI